MSVSAPLPAPLTGAEEGSFAHDTVVRRLPDIAGRVLQENQLRSSAVAKLEQLIRELPGGKIRQLADGAPDQGAWRQTISRYDSHDWLEVPWFFAETYFYRRILEATGFFLPGPGQGLDPYGYQKRLGLETAKGQIRALSSRLDDWIVTGWNGKALVSLVATDLWGNQADLSLWPADVEKQPGHVDTKQQQDYVLVDDTDLILDRVNRLGDSHKVDFIVDNAGLELVCDLCLADYLVSCGDIDTVRFHLKAHPTFVSDATIEDVRQTLEVLAGDEDAAVLSFATRLKTHLDSRRLQLKADTFWTSPLAGWEMPAALRAELASSHLVISKGDANYRRLLGDLHWSFTTPFAEIVSYFPASLASLRILKSEVAAGLSAGLIRWLDRHDQEWLTNGRWGMVQFAYTASA